MASTSEGPNAAPKRPQEQETPEQPLTLVQQIQNAYESCQNEKDGTEKRKNLPELLWLQHEEQTFSNHEAALVAQEALIPLLQESFMSVVPVYWLTVSCDPLALLVEGEKTTTELGQFPLLAKAIGDLLYQMKSRSVRESNTYDCEVFQNAFRQKLGTEDQEFLLQEIPVLEEFISTDLNNNAVEHDLTESVQEESFGSSTSENTSSEDERSPITNALKPIVKPVDKKTSIPQRKKRTRSFPSVEPALAYRNLFRLLVSRHSPVVVCFENTHWLDEQTMILVASDVLLDSQLEGLTIVAITTYYHDILSGEGLIPNHCLNRMLALLECQEVRLSPVSLVGYCSHVTPKNWTAVPCHIQEALQIAACFRSQMIPLKLLWQTLSDDPDKLHLLQSEIEKYPHLVSLDPTRLLVSFACEGTREAIYSEILTAEQRSRLHYSIGKALWRSWDLEQLDAHVDVVVDQLILGKKLIERKKERIAIAKLCLRAGEKAAKRSSFQTAYGYLSKGQSLLCDECWVEDYELCLHVYSALAEVALGSCHSDDVNSLTDTVLAKARNLGDTIAARTTKVHAIGNSGDVFGAVEYGLSSLSLIGIKIPTNPSKMRSLWVALRLTRQLKGMSNESILRSKHLKDHDIAASICLLKAVLLYAFFAKEELCVHLVDRIMSLTFKHGLSAMAGPAFVSCGALVIKYVQHQLHFFLHFLS